jgi:hypothetical protein
MRLPTLRVRACLCEEEGTRGLAECVVLSVEDRAPQTSLGAGSRDRRKRSLVLFKAGDRTAVVQGRMTADDALEILAHDRGRIGGAIVVQWRFDAL